MKQKLYALYRILRFTWAYSGLSRLPGKKITLVVFKDLIRWFWRSGTYCSLYLLWGLDSTDKAIRDVISKREAQKAINMGTRLLLGKLGLRTTDYEVLCQDKQVSATYFRQHNFSCIDTLDVIVCRKSIYQGDSALNCLIRFAKEKKVLIKAVSEDSSNGIYFIEYMDSELSVTDIHGEVCCLKEVLGNGVWIVQPLMESHSVLKEFCDGVLNTTRIVTVNCGEEIVCMGAYQAFGTDKCKTDSWDHGAIYVGIDLQSQSLVGNGYRLASKYYYYQEVENHPDSNLVFNNAKIPFIGDSIRMCIDAHQYLYGVFIVGWDIAITDKGPVIVEANNRPGLNAFQLFNSQFKQDLEAILRRLEIDNQYK